jgi:putative peptidoglycan lipid II flippase
LKCLPDSLRGWGEAIFPGSLAHAGLALSISLAACINALLLYIGLRRRKVYAPQPGWLRFMLQIATALAVMGAALWFSSGAAETWTARGSASRVLHLSMIVVLGVVSYFGMLFALGLRPRDFRRRAVQ